LFQSSKFSEKDFDTFKRLGIEAVIDLEGGVDLLPAMVEKEDYKYWPIQDIPELPDLKRLDEVAQWGYEKWRSGRSLLTHCAAGCNRSGLVNGKILILKGLSGKEAVKLIRAKRPGALTNQVFATYLESL
jgi:protein-tyrosine phosphatase